jgi:diguanylate cyclase (GGDEF)-like protein
MTCTLLVFGADILFHAFPAGASNQIQKFASSVLFFGAAALCVAKGRTARHERAEWRLFGLAMALWGAASTYYSFFLWNLPEVPVPSLADVGWLAFYVPAYLAVYKLMRKRAGAFVRAAWLDALVGVLGVGGAAALVVFDVVLDNTTGSVAAVVTNLAYPIGDLGLLALLVAAMTVLGWRGSGVLRWMAPALAVFAVTDSFYLVQVADGSYGGGGWVDLGWPVAAFLVGLAAWHTERPSQRAVPRTGTVFAVPTVVGIAALGLLVLDHFNETTLLALGVAAASLVIILARLHLTVGDNVRLLDQSRREATTDALTGLGNRRQLVADLAVHIDRLDPRRPVVLTLFDLDGFKQYNDTFGHLAGDQLLQRLAGSLSDLLEGCGTAYRMGGDEFCTLWEQPAARLAGITAQDAVQALSEEGGAFAIGCSHGSVLLPTETSDPVMALQAADRSMYLHKRKGLPDRQPPGRRRAGGAHGARHGRVSRRGGARAADGPAPRRGQGRHPRPDPEQGGAPRRRRVGARQAPHHHRRADPLGGAGARPGGPARAGDARGVRRQWLPRRARG